jgi:serine/tyrosine/threonine adenylyltransferase
LDELIERVERKGEREILERVLHMALNPFNERWGWNEEEEERFCGDVPRNQRAMQCSCSS